MTYSAETLVEMKVDIDNREAKITEYRKAIRAERKAIKTIETLMRTQE